jgi:hypothetical protein
MTHKEQAQSLIDKAIKILSAQYNSEGKQMSRSQCIPKAKMIARDNVGILMSVIGREHKAWSFWNDVNEQIDKCN